MEKVSKGGTDVEVGQMIGNAWLWSACETCHHRRQGWETLCEFQINVGYGTDGSSGEYMVVDTKFAAHTPKGPSLLRSLPSSAPEPPSIQDSNALRSRRASRSSTLGSAASARSQCRMR